MKKTKKEPFKIKRRSMPRKPAMSRGRKIALERAVFLMERIEDIKMCYKELDQLTDELLRDGFTEGFIADKHIVMKDKFAIKNTVWKSTPQRRFELELA